jgi:hypothetical protein
MANETWLQDRIKEFSRTSDNYIEQVAEEYAASQGHEGTERDEDKTFAIEYLNDHIHVEDY